ncbi:hypothetical protein ACO0K7_11670 [Undibacterium sp. Ji67W]|uniref:hypothetical protein n=1 Tax=Undibacterium sp. Ji67W TaxID=3413042 RepID=UPI003BF40E98
MATVTSKKEAPIAKATAAPALKATVAKASVAKAPLKKVAAKKPVVASEKKVANDKPTAKTNGIAKTPVRRVATKVDIPKSAIEIVDKVKKAKLVRDSFTMPEAEYAVLGQVKRACLKAGVEVKKSQLLRIGLALLNKTDVPALKKLIGELAPLKAGRPKKER